MEQVSGRLEEDYGTPPRSPSARRVTASRLGPLRSDRREACCPAATAHPARLTATATRSRRSCSPTLTSCSDLPAHQLLLSLIHEVRPPVLRPAGFGAFGAERLFLAVADGANAIRRNAQRDQRLLGGVGAIVAQRQVVLGRAALVAVALDGELDVGMLLQEARIGLTTPADIAAVTS